MARNAREGVTPGPTTGERDPTPVTALRSFFGGPGPIVGAGLKMFLGHRDTLDYLDGLREHEDLWRQVRAFVLPTFTELDAASRMLPGTGVSYGAQDGHWESAGAFTGAVSARALAELGCTFLEVGHAERLRWFGESWEVACRKTAAAVDAGLVPLICVGEQQATSDGSAAEQVASQLTAALQSAGGSPVLVAYEPCWAIGAADAAAADHVTFVVERIRELLSTYPAESAVLYGGSVSTDSVAELVKTPIDGVFVGRAATTVTGFAEIAQRIVSAWTETPVRTNRGVTR